MDCQTAQDRIRSERFDAEVEAHLDTCVDCARVAAEHAGLSALAEPPPADLHALRGAVRGALQRERGPLAWLRSRRTPTRIALALGGLLVPALLAGWALLRVDIAVYPLARWAAIAVVLLAATGAAVGAGLHPLWRPARGGLARGIAVAGAAAVVALAVLPPAHADHAVSLMGTGPMLATKALGCLLYGLAVAAPGVILLRLLDRSDRPWLGRGALLAAVAGGLAGNLSLHLHCPLVAPIHLVLGHATVLAALMVLPVGAWLAARPGGGAP